MAKIKVFDNFGKEIKNGSLICIIGEKNRFGFVKIVYEGIRFTCANVGSDYLDNKTIMIKEGGMGISGIYTYEELKVMDIVVISEVEELNEK